MIYSSGGSNCQPELSDILAEFFTQCLKESCFPDCWKVSLVVLVFKNVGGRSTAEIIELLIPWKIETFFLISSFVLGLLDQLWIFLQLYLIELLGLLTGLGLLEL